MIIHVIFHNVVYSQLFTPPRTRQLRGNPGQQHPGQHLLGQKLRVPAKQNLPQIRAACRKANCAKIAERLPFTPKVLGSLPGFGAGSGQPARVLPGFAARVWGPFAASKESTLLAECRQYKLCNHIQMVLPLVLTSQLGA